MSHNVVPSRNSQILLGPHKIINVLEGAAYFLWMDMIVTGIWEGSAPDREQDRKMVAMYDILARPEKETAEDTPQ